MRMEKEQRVYWLDVARVLAIVSITLNHAVNRAFDNNNTLLDFEQLPLYLNIIKSIAYVFSRIGVPLFLMITGVLVLNKKMSSEEDVKKFYKHNWLQLFITTEIWYTIMYWYLSVGAESVLRTEGIGKAILRWIETLFFIDPFTMGSMWYMPMILCVYLVLPFISMFIHKLSEKTILIPIALAAVSGMIVPNINAFINMLGHDVQINFVLDIANLFSVYLIYVIVGYLIQKKWLEKLKDSVVVIGILLSFVFCSIYQLWAYSREGSYILYYDFFGILICAMLIFELIRRKITKPVRFQSKLTYLSRISFGIYFVHICIMSGMVFVLSFDGWNKILQLLTLEIVSFVGSVIIINLLSRIPFCKKYLFVIK